MVDGAIAHPAATPKPDVNPVKASGHVSINSVNPDTLTPKASPAMVSPQGYAFAASQSRIF